MPDAPTFSPGPHPRTVRAADGTVRPVPDGWELLPPGDPGLTRRVKAAGEFLAVAERRGRKLFSRGVWAPAETIERAKTDLSQDRGTAAYANRQASAARRRDATQTGYVEDFAAAVVAFLNFHPTHAEQATELARRVTAHATPVGSGTVARTKRIPIERRAEAAVLAWMRHHTTAYDRLSIPRVKGRRRDVRRELAAGSRAVLDCYRTGRPAADDCPLRRAMAGPRSESA